MFQLKAPPPILAPVPAPLPMPAAAQAIRDRWQEAQALLNEGVRHWDVGNETCNPFPFPIDMDNRQTYADQTLYYPANAGTDYSAMEPLQYPDNRLLHRILRFR